MRVDVMGGGAEIGAALFRDISRGMAVGAENDTFIECRHRERAKKEGWRTEEAVWAETTRREKAQRRAEDDRFRLAKCRRLEAVYAKRSHYGEWTEIPPADAPAPERRDPDTRTRDPERLMPPAKATT